MDKDPTQYSALTYAWIALLSMWGGLVNWIRKRRSGEARPFNLVELIGELVTSAFVGVLTFWLCESAGTSQLLTAALVGISGHMGARGIYLLETWLTSRFDSHRGHS